MVISPPHIDDRTIHYLVTPPCSGALAQAVTMVVSLLHTVFDMLAFRNDIGFWNNNKSMEGLSARRYIYDDVTCGC